MNIFKKITTLLICLMIVFVPIINGLTYYAYADDENSVPSGYTPVTDDMELAQAFNDYCKSRDAYFTSSMPGATYTYIYNYMKEGLGYLGYNIDQLQEGLYKTYNSGGDISRWYWDSQSIGLANRLFAYLINENELEVGDTANELLYSGDWFVDDDGNGCLVYEISNNSVSWQGDMGGSYTQCPDVISWGSSLKYTTDQLKVASSPVEYNVFNRTYSLEISYDSTYNYWSFVGGGIIYANGPIDRNRSYWKNGYVGIAKNVNTNKYYLCKMDFGTWKYTNQSAERFWPTVYITRIDETARTPSHDPVNINISFTSNNSVINNNNYEGDTIINNEGDVINNNEGDTIINYNPYPDGGGTITPPSGGNGGGGSDGTINFPNINFSLPEIDWSLGDLSNKFPFSIPFDLVQLVTVLDAPAEAPRFEGTVNFGFTTWDYDINLESFDTVASVCRTTELVLFIFGLILITRNLIKG